MNDTKFLLLLFAIFLISVITSLVVFLKTKECKKDRDCKAGQVCTNNKCEEKPDDDGEEEDDDDDDDDDDEEEGEGEGEGEDEEEDDGVTNKPSGGLSTGETIGAAIGGVVVIVLPLVIYSIFSANKVSSREKSPEFTGAFPGPPAKGAGAAGEAAEGAAGGDGNRRKRGRRPPPPPPIPERQSAKDARLAKLIKIRKNKEAPPQIPHDDRELWL